MIYIGADHGGFKAKQKLFEYLKAKGFEVEDSGTDSEEAVDYPLIAEKVARKVVADPENRGILICRSSGGVCIAANKVKGVYAASAWNPEVAAADRNDDNINVLCLAADYLPDEVIQQTAQAFLDTPFQEEERYKRRLKQIQDIENKNSKS